MKLTELEPKWCVDVNEGRHGMGLSFLCPVHRNHKLVVMFANPIDGGAASKSDKYLWHREGDTFETLTLGPSIDASGHQLWDTIEFKSCWHGFIRNGEVT